MSDFLVDVNINRRITLKLISDKWAKNLLISGLYKRSVNSLYCVASSTRINSESGELEMMRKKEVLDLCDVLYRLVQSGAEEILENI